MAKYKPSDYDIYLFREGSHFRSYQMLGAHLVEEEGKKGVRFSVWAPHARKVCIAGDFNNWKGQEHFMERVEDSGIWTLFIPGLKEGTLYKYEIHTPQGEVLLKSDPYAFYSEAKPKTASIVYSLEGYSWGDGKWQEKKSKEVAYNSPLLIYEVHLGSWKRGEGGRYLTYRELARDLVDYVAEMGYTHVELMPLVEHPFDGSWGYQGTGYYSVTSRYGNPKDFMYLVDSFHQRGIGVILDWVPGHFCRDGHGLREFDGTPLFEYQDKRRAENIQWDTMNFDLGRPEVHSFLVSNALFWMEVFHIDGLRVDAVAAMLYLDYGYEESQKQLTNKYGGLENLEAIDFLRKLNLEVFKTFPQALMIAEESSEWPLVSAPTYLGGLGFNFKWNMGWMNDILRYMEIDPINRKWHHLLLTFSMWYAYSENFILPLSHDEVVHGKKSLLDKMPGDYWQKFANLRVLLGYMITHPGKKLLFMGGELGQFTEWKYQDQLEWFLLDFEMHRKLHDYVKKINSFYLEEEALWSWDYQREGFHWIDPHDYSQSIITFLRRGKGGRLLLVVCNFTPVVHYGYRVGVPRWGEYREIFNSDDEIYGGSGQLNHGPLIAFEGNWHNQPYFLEMKIPPLAVSVLEPLGEEKGAVRKKGGSGD